ncbi:MAG: hypothetical protein C5B48_05530 [Candidatus Rokuibacteriota bacterium]|nr:MAG: hypothetical protein C5B48_05530 [Candidatus Rokubacteria bacterium]
MRIAVLTTSYPRRGDESAGAFVLAGVEHLRAGGVGVEVVSPAGFRDFGLAYGDGIAANLRARPVRAVLLPAFMASYARAARRAAHEADLVHAHWLPSGLAAELTGKPFVVQVWGTDLELAQRLPWLFQRVLRQAAVVVAPSTSLAGAAAALGAERIRVLPSGVEIPERVAEPEQPPHLLYVGRLSAEKGIEELAEAAAGLPLVAVGDGPLSQLLPGAVGFVPPAELGVYYEQASVVVCPSRREGYGVAAREAMAHGRPVVASAVGGLLDAVEDGVTGLLVPPRDPRALREALERLLGDSRLRKQLGAAARERARERFSWERATTATLDLYAEVLAG